MRRLVCAALVLAALFGGCSLGEEETRPPQLGVQPEDEEAAETLGSPSSATRNTIRVGGSDSAADAAGVAGALYPATGDSDRPTAVALVEQDDWITGISASVLTGPPIGAPILLSDGDELPGRHRGRARAARPEGVRPSPRTPR